MKKASLPKQLVTAYLHRKAQEQQAVIDKAPVFGKRYGAAVDELEEIKDLLQQVNAL